MSDPAPYSATPAPQPHSCKWWIGATIVTTIIAAILALISYALIAYSTQVEDERDELQTKLEEQQTSAKNDLFFAYFRTDRPKTLIERDSKSTIVRDELERIGASFYRYVYTCLDADQARESVTKAAAKSLADKQYVFWLKAIAVARDASFEADDPPSAERLRLEDIPQKYRQRL